jgi:hypothetical protein
VDVALFLLPQPAAPSATATTARARSRRVIVSNLVDLA